MLQLRGVLGAVRSHRHRQRQVLDSLCETTLTRQGDAEAKMGVVVIWRGRDEVREIGLGRRVLPRHQSGASEGLAGVPSTRLASTQLVNKSQTIC